MSKYEVELDNLYAVSITDSKGEETIHLKYAPSRKKLRRGVTSRLESTKARLNSVTFVSNRK